MKAILFALILMPPVAAQPVGDTPATEAAKGWQEHIHGGRGHGRGGNSAYAKARIEERDRLLDKLQSMKICRGC